MLSKIWMFHVLNSKIYLWQWWRRITTSSFSWFTPSQCAPRSTSSYLWLWNKHTNYTYWWQNALNYLKKWLRAPRACTFPSSHRIEGETRSAGVTAQASVGAHVFSRLLAAATQKRSDKAKQRLHACFQGIAVGFLGCVCKHNRLCSSSASCTNFTVSDFVRRGRANGNLAFLLAAIWTFVAGNVVCAETVSYYVNPTLSRVMLCSAFFILHAFTSSTR